MFKRRREKPLRRLYAAWPAWRSTKVVAGLLSAVVWILIGTTHYDLDDATRIGTPADRFIEAITQPPMAQYAAAVLVPLGVAIWLIMNRRRPLARSRKRGGGGLRLGQGPLADRLRFEAWMTRNAGTLRGDTVALGFWAADVAVLVCLWSVLPLFFLGYQLLAPFTLAVTISLALGWGPPGFLVLFVALIVGMTSVIGRYMRHPVLPALILFHCHRACARALARLSPTATMPATPPPEPGHDPDTTARQRRRSLLFRGD